MAKKEGTPGNNLKDDVTFVKSKVTNTLAQASQGFSIREPISQVLHLHFAEKRELAATFLRFQEHFESPEFRGKIFSLDEYKDWYKTFAPRAVELKRFTYYEDWGGFNIPSSVLIPFFEGKFSPLSAKEKKLLGVIRRYISDNTNLDVAAPDTQFAKKLRRFKFYVIGTCAQEKAVIKHELAHALYFTSHSYKREVKAILARASSVEKRKIAKLLLQSGGYHRSVIPDETHAYLLTERVFLKKRGVDVVGLHSLIVRLGRTYGTYIAKYRQNGQRKKRI
jgi:hypothetical protein